MSLLEGVGALLFGDLNGAQIVRELWRHAAGKVIVGQGQQGGAIVRREIRSDRLPQCLLRRITAGQVQQSSRRTWTSAASREHGCERCNHHDSSHINSFRRGLHLSTLCQGAA